MTEARRRDALALSILTLLPLLFFFDILRGERSFFLRDIANFHYPTKKLLRDIVLRGEFPSWNPLISAGQPLAANPQHEVFYPPNWLIFLPDFLTGFHLAIVFHVVVALIGMYVLLRSLDIRPGVAILGAVSFGMGGIVLSMLNVLPFLFTTAWLPLTIAFARRFLLHRNSRDFALATLFLGIQFVIGEPVTALQTLILIAILAARRRNGRALLQAGSVVVGALLLASVQVLPAVDFFRDSVRSLPADPTIAGTWSLPFQRLPELINPDLLGNPAGELEEWRGAALYPRRIVPFFFSIYCGLAVTIVAIAGMSSGIRGWRVAAATIALSVVLALGSHTPLLRSLYALGVGGWVRFPEKFILLAAFTIIVFGTRALHALLDGDARLRTHAILAASALAVAGLAAGTIGGAQGWIPAASRAALLALLLLVQPRIRRSACVALLALFVLADFYPLARRLSPTVPSSFYRDPPRAERLFAPDRSTYRLLHYGALDMTNADAARYARPAVGRYWAYRNMLLPLTPATYGIATVLNLDYDRTALHPTEDFAQATLQLASSRAPQGLTNVASMSNVRYVGFLQPFEKALADARGDRTAIQPLRLVRGPDRPRYYFASEVVPIGDRQDFVRRVAGEKHDWSVAYIDRASPLGEVLSKRSGAAQPLTPASGMVRVLHESSNTTQLDVRANGWGVLVMSVTPHRYWKIRIDGSETEPMKTNLGYQSVVVPAGRHSVEMRYRNPLFALGGIVTLVSLAGLAVLYRRGITMRAL